MGKPDSMAAVPDEEEFHLPARKRPKVSELPLSSAQRSAMEGLLGRYKKQGGFDDVRKKSLRQYNESAQRGMFEVSLRKFTGDEIDREPMKYLKPDRRQAVPLLEGAAARGRVYDQMQADVDAYIEQYLEDAEKTLREIRRKEIGDEAAREEIARGVKSDETYAAEAEVRRKARERKHADDEKARLKKESQERKKKELEALKKKQEELMKETEKLQREQKRRQEREAWKQAEKEKEKERIKKYNEEREKQAKEAEEREKAVVAERERRQKDREQRDRERLEQEALALLLREGEAMADRSRRPELERSESMEPPSRLRQGQAPHNTVSKEDMRSRGLMPTSLTLRRSSDLPSGTPTGPRGAVTPAHADDDRRRVSRLRSPSPARSTYSRSRRESPPRDDRRSSRRDDSRGASYREGTMRRESYYRSISQEREAWKASRRRVDDRSERERPRERDRGREREREKEKEKEKGEEGEVLERASTRARSRSRDSHRRRESPKRSSYRERSRSRSPPRRHRDHSRRRSRSPAAIDRYVPGGGGGGGGGGGAQSSRRPRDDRRDRSRERERFRGPPEGDRWAPGDSSARDDADRPKRRERSRSRERRRERSRERDAPREREREREDGRDRERERDREKERETPRERERERGEINEEKPARD